MNPLAAPLFTVVMSLSGTSSGGDFAITSSVIGAGGGPSTGGEFSMRATIGQFQTGVSSGGDFLLSGGFWAGGQTAPQQDRIFANDFETE
ncbi:MAG: hypothetical protein QNJ40_14585 [Xanthomonadales bacterium]|nr:hypothetical protein [Xanthomonadales bacterium]